LSCTLESPPAALTGGVFPERRRAARVIAILLTRRDAFVDPINNSMPNIRCFKIQPTDNVATLLDDGVPGPAELLGATPGRVDLLEPIALGHKVAVTDILRGQSVLKFGISIGTATADIRAGQWVHLHNCASNFDQRSQTLDVHTGAVTDTKYE
jgi:hypothetical protein